jgi:alpha-aminoadipic semialdehyde synthase
VCGITGQGRVARGALELLKELPTERIAADDLPRRFARGRFDPHVVYRVEFFQGDLYEPRVTDETFERHRLHRHPDRFVGRLERLLPYVNVLVNGIFWEPRFPRLVTNSFLRRLYETNPNPRLRVIGDITCDVGGSIEPTVRATTVDDPVYVYEPLADRVVDGLEGTGPVIMAVDKLPTELPRQSSETFGDALTPFVPALAGTDFSRPLEDLDLPAELQAAVIAHGGRLSPAFAHLDAALAEVQV